MTAEIARTTTLEGLALILRERRQQLGLSQLVVDELGGLQTGYTGKIEAEALHPGRGKGLGKVSIPLLLGALGVEIALMPAARQHRGETGSKRENFYSRRGRELRALQLKQQTPKQRKKIARAAAKARWAKVKAERERMS